MKQVPSMTKQRATEDVKAIYRDIQASLPHCTDDVCAALTMAAVVHLNAHPIYIVKDERKDLFD